MQRLIDGVQHAAGRRKPRTIRAINGDEFGVGIIPAGVRDEHQCEPRAPRPRHRKIDLDALARIFVLEGVERSQIHLLARGRPDFEMCLRCDFKNPDFLRFRSLHFQPCQFCNCSMISAAIFLARSSSSGASEMAATTACPPPPKVSQILARSCLRG